MKPLLTTVLSLLLVGVFALTGCSNTSKMLATGLEIEVTSIERETDGSVAVSWQIRNTNIVAYMFSQLTHKIQLNGVVLGTISEKEALALPASSHAGRTSRIANIDANASRVLTEAVAAGSANYRIDSQITVLIYDDNDEKSVLGNTGTVKVTAK